MVNEVALFASDKDVKGEISTYNNRFADDHGHGLRKNNSDHKTKEVELVNFELAKSITLGG